MADSRARILDANLNRAAEGLRVSEDVCRFHWNLVGLSGELKELRHALLDAGSRLHREALVAARDVPGDVGRDLQIEPGAPSGLALADLAVRNLHRAREAVRALEEVSRGDQPEVSSAFQSIRYRLYGVEKALFHLRHDPSRRRAQLDAARVYLLATGSLCRCDFEATVRAALDAGVDIVQLREKGVDGRALLERARLLRELTARVGALFIVNDRPDIARLAHADGVHVGQEDLPVAAVREIVGPDALIGASTHSVADARRAVTDGADMIGVGPMFPTATKDAGPIFGPDRLASVIAAFDVPAFGIGGIDADNVTAIVAAGGTRVAVSSCILGSDDPAASVRALRARLTAA